MTLAETYLIWKAPKNLVLDSGFEPQIIADLRLRIQEFTGQGSAGASRGLCNIVSCKITDYCTSLLNCINPELLIYN